MRILVGAVGAARRAARQQAQMQEQIAQILPPGFEDLANGDGGFDSVMPLMMRSQRVRDLAHTQHCGWGNAAPQQPPSQQEQK